MPGLNKPSAESDKMAIFCTWFNMKEINVKGVKGKVESRFELNFSRIYKFTITITIHGKKYIICFIGI